MEKKCLGLARAMAWPMFAWLLRIDSFFLAEVLPRLGRCLVNNFFIIFDQLQVKDFTCRWNPFKNEKILYRGFEATWKINFRLISAPPSTLLYWPKKQKQLLSMFVHIWTRIALRRQEVRSSGCKTREITCNHKVHFGPKICLIFNL